MSRKFSERRRGAFLRAVEETGNQTLAAERAKVSRSWVTMTRAADAGFDAAVKAAVLAAKDRLRAMSQASLYPSTGSGRGRLHTKFEGGGDGADGASPMRPAKGWGSLDGAELVVRGTNGRRVQIARARVSQWSPAVEARFLATLAATCNVKAACAAVGKSAASAYNHRLRWPGFAEQWQAAIDTGCARLEASMLHRVCNPFSDPEFATDASLPAVTVADGLQLLRFHERRERGPFGAPGRKGRLAS